LKETSFRTENGKLVVTRGRKAGRPLKLKPKGRVKAERLVAEVSFNPEPGVLPGSFVGAREEGDGHVNVHVSLDRMR